MILSAHIVNTLNLWILYQSFWPVYFRVVFAMQEVENRQGKISENTFQYAP
jgi:hypothetical protein